MQHDEETGPFEVHDALMTAVTAWELTGCPCCSPTVLDDALERLSDEDWRRLQAFSETLATSCHYRRNDHDGCTCSDSMEPCPIHNAALAALCARQAIAPGRKADVLMAIVDERRSRYHMALCHELTHGGVYDELGQLAAIIGSGHFDHKVVGQRIDTIRGELYARLERALAGEAATAETGLERPDA